jgi:IMP dehydrogenase
MGVNMNNNLNNKLIDMGITFDDVLVVPNYSDILPSEVDLKTRLTNNIHLNIPLISAAMDTVTEHQLAIALAKLGGVGVIHKNLTLEQQAAEVKKVKEHSFEIEEFMNPACDSKNRLLVGAAVSTGNDTVTRVKTLIDNGVDFVVVDSAHGHSKGIIETVANLRQAYPTLEIIAGNIATAAAAKALVEAGANAVKVGIGPGSICTTRVVAGVGLPQISAISNAYEYCVTNNIPIVADGGIKHSGDIVKALGAGANTVMLGSIFAGTEESPGSIIHVEGNSYKTYVGMGSLAAMSRGSSDRYFQKGAKKLVPEGIESMVNYKGPVSDIVFQMLGGLRSGMGYTGSHTIDELRTNTKFVQITNAGLVESHPHDVKMIQAAPNYNK